MNHLSSTAQHFEQVRVEIESARTAIRSQTNTLSSAQVSALTLSLDNFFTLLTCLEDQVLAEIKDLKNGFAADLHRLNRTVNEMNHNLARLTNNTFYDENGGILEDVPFLVGERPSDLPLIRSINDINALTEEQIDRFLAGYGLSIT